MLACTSTATDNHVCCVVKRAVLYRMSSFFFLPSILEKSRKFFLKILIISFPLKKYNNLTMIETWKYVRKKLINFTFKFELIFEHDAFYKAIIENSLIR